MSAEDAVTFTTTLTRVTFNHGPPSFKRGDYLPADGVASSVRVTRVDARTGTLTIRAPHVSPTLEWLHVRWEDWVVWPLRDVRAWFRVQTHNALVWLENNP